MVDSNPAVSVFHFTSRISSAKIKKYKQATERGMGSAKRAGATPAADAAAAASSSTSMDPPPAKRPRLKLNVGPRPTESPGDTIAVSRPKRKSTFKFRNYSQDSLDFDDDGAEDPSPAESSSLSSLSSLPVSAKEPSPAPPEEETPPSTSARDDYDGDFMSYYIAGDDDEKDKPKAQAPAKPKPLPKSAPLSKTASQPPKQVPAPMPDQPQLPQRAKRQPTGSRAKPLPVPTPDPQPAVGRSRAPIQSAPPPPQQRSVPPPPQRQPMPQGFPPAPPPIPEPVIQCIDMVYEPRPTKPDTIAIMIQKLQHLSDSLCSFGGMPVAPISPLPEKAPLLPKKAPQATSRKRASSIDKILAAFEDSDSEESQGHVEITALVKDLNYPLPFRGSSDGALTYGIQFIMNALKSWAEQRLKAQFIQQFHAQQQLQMQQAAQPRSRPGGRSKKNDDPRFSLPAHPIIQLNLAETPEGIAIKAFQAVLDSGCLQTNIILPVELTRALRHLYMQIDHLINQNARREPPWKMSSYAAQMNAQKKRVEKFKEAVAQEESAREQYYAQMQGQAPPMHGMPPSAYPSDVEVERRRNMQHANQQPYNSHQHLNPMQLHSQPPTPGTIAPSPGASNATPGFPPATGHVGANGSPAGTGGPAHMENIKLYTAGYLPRSKQSMKFSFAPQNAAAVRAFGPQAFPDQLPQRALKDEPSPMGETMDGIEVINLDTSSPPKVTARARAEVVQPPMGGFTAVNFPPRKSVPAVSPATTDSPAESTIEVAMKRSSSGFSTEEEEEEERAPSGASKKRGRRSGS